jgi:peptidoglycan/LPS O-acetylase OafA/YrhL
MVVAFHARLPGFSGGFAGVDVFFVLSGYLITRLLLGELAATGSLDVGAFYARRARRLLPALGLLLVSLAVFVWPFVSAFDQRGIGTGMAAAALFSANMLFYRRAQDYFADTRRPDLLTHTWSLSVEEQFYAVWPLFLMIAFILTRKLRIRWLLPTGVAAVAIVSFTATVANAANHDAAFYWPTSRMWELGLGALLALALQEGFVGGIVSDVVGIVGLAAVAVSAFLITASSAGITWHLLLPTVGTVAIILNVSRANSSLVRIGARWTGLLWLVLMALSCVGHCTKVR